MKRLFLNVLLYGFLLLLALEIWVRVFHLHKDHPQRYLDSNNVEKWVPNQEGHNVTGNRRQNFSEYHINNSGFNSYREFKPTSDKIEIALVGDSFIEGFHQNYYNSIGKKIESNLNDIEVYEYGYAGYDLADQLHLIHQYKSQFDLIDHVILGVKFANDLERSSYEVQEARLALESSTMKLLKKSKLLVYARSIGALDPPQIFLGNILTFIRNRGVVNKPKTTIKDVDAPLVLKQLDNFKNLISLYGFDKERFVILLDSSITHKIFINYLEDNNLIYIDIAPVFQASEKPTTLIYDRHWNNHGRNLVANIISDYFKGTP